MKKIDILTFILIIVFIAANGIILWKEVSSKEEIYNVKITPVQYAQWLASLPDTPFRRNMLIVFRAEFERDSGFLNDVLQSYLEVKQDQQKKKESAKY
jgi:hypothetical protein